MTPNDRADVLAKLAAGRAGLLASVEGMTDTEAAAQPAPDRWSAIGIIEHVAMVETNMIRRLKEIPPTEGEPGPGREERLYELLKTPTRKVSAPERVHPKNDCRSLADALARFEAARAQTLAFVESCPHDLRLCPTAHPLLGPITGMECMAIVAAHVSRHAAQIREMRGL